LPPVARVSPKVPERIIKLIRTGKESQPRHEEIGENADRIR
jgi:hypothetical protein